MEGTAHKPSNTSEHTRSVYQAVSYFDIFNYPLTASEIYQFCPVKITESELDSVLKDLVKSGKLCAQDQYFFLKDAPASNVNSRIENETYLKSKLLKIKRYAKLVSLFPFVRAVLISGSVSKGVLSKDGDVDYFIIAESGRVWLCRTLLIVFKKIFLLNSKKYFCVNYFVDTDNLSVPDNNLFVATEIKTLVPVYNNRHVNEFMEANSWVNKMYPNNRLFKNAFFEVEKRKPFVSRALEKVFHGGLGEQVDNYFFKKTLQRWKNKFPHFNGNQFDLNMRSYKSVSKHHPQGNQAKVLNGLALRMSKLGH